VKTNAAGERSTKAVHPHHLGGRHRLRRHSLVGQGHYEHSAAFLEPGVHASQPSALVENNEIPANGYGGTSMQDAQNGVFRYNDFGLAIIDGAFYPHNGAGAKAMQFSEGNKTTSLYNAKAYGNTLGGEYIQGCSMPDHIVDCANNDY
jgi:hypothetical protein